MASTFTMHYSNDKLCFWIYNGYKNPNRMKSEAYYKLTGLRGNVYFLIHVI